MTLIPCPECRRAVSSAAFQCPGCGQPLRDEEPRAARRRDPVLPLVLAGAVLASVLGSAGIWMAATRFAEARQAWGGGPGVEVVRTVDIMQVIEPPPPPHARLTVIDGPVAALPVGMEMLPEIQNGAEVSRMIARVYPPLLRDAGIPGTAVVRFRVLEDGRPDLTTLSVEHATHDAFGDSAWRIVGRMRFRPGMMDGHPVASWVTVPISFDPTR